MSTDVLAKPTNNLPFLKESEKDYWNKLLDSNIRAGTMACMWCLKTTYVKKISLAFYRWKLNAAKEVWRGNTSPIKGFAQTSGLRTPSTSQAQTEERPQHSLRPVSTVLANAISLMNQLKETDAERDLNTRLFASPSASVKAANAMAASVLEFDSKSHGDVPRNASFKSILGSNSNDSVPMWEHRRRAGSTGSAGGAGSMDLGLFDAPEGQSAESLAAYNKQRLAYVLRSILPAESIVGGNGAGGGAGASGASAENAMNLDGRRGPERNDYNNNYTTLPLNANAIAAAGDNNTTQEDELDAYLRHALMSQNHDPTTRGQILMALSHNLANKPSGSLSNMNIRPISARDYGAVSADLPGHSLTDAEVSARSSLSLLKSSNNNNNGSSAALHTLKNTGSNPTSGNNVNSFPRVRANSRTNSPNARTARKSLENYSNSNGLAYNTNHNANSQLPEGFYEELNTLDPRSSHFAFSHTHITSGNIGNMGNMGNNRTTTTSGNGQVNNGINSMSAPVTPAVGTYEMRRQSFPASAPGHTLQPTESFSGYSMLSESVQSYHSSSANNSISHSNAASTRRVPGYLLPTNSFRKKQNPSKSSVLNSRDKSRSPGGRMITNSNSKHVTNVVNGGSYSPTGAYTVKQGGGKRSGSAGREGYSVDGNVVSGDSYPTLRNHETSYHNIHTAPYPTQPTTHPTTHNTTNTSTNNTNHTSSNASYANMSFLDYQARKANLSAGQRSPVRRNSANMDTSRNYNGNNGNGGNTSGHGSHSAGVSVLGGEENDLNEQTAPLLSHSHDSTGPGHSTQTRDVNSAQASVPPLNLGGPMLPLSLQAQQAHEAHSTTAGTANQPELTYEVYDTYHNSKLHSNSVDLFDPHSNTSNTTTTLSTHKTNHNPNQNTTQNTNQNTSQNTNQNTTHNTSLNTSHSTHPSGYKDKHPTIHTTYSEEEGPHATERALYTDDEPHYYNPNNHTTSQATHYPVHTTHETHTMKDTHDTHGAYTFVNTNDTPVYPTNRHSNPNSLQPSPYHPNTHTLSTNPVHSSSTNSVGKKSNSNSSSGGKKPKGMDKAQRELLMYGDVHGKAPNWHKTLRN